MGIGLETIFDLSSDKSTKEEVKTLRFYVTKDGRNTTAIEEGHELDGINLILKRYPFVDPEWLVSKKRYYVHDKLVATAICHEEDTPDEKEGKKVAMKKLNAMIKGQEKSALKLFEHDMRNQFAQK